MPEWVEVHTQAELDEALARPNVIPVCRGDGKFAILGDAVVRAADETEIEAAGSATVEAWGSALVRVKDSASVAAWESARVEARDSANVEAWDGAAVTAFDSASVQLWDSASVDARDEVTVEANYRATVEARDSVSVIARQFALVRARGSATVRASGSANVEAWDANVVRAWGSAIVNAGGSATIEAWDATTVEAWGSAKVKAWGSAIVRVRGGASVEAAERVAVTRHGDGPKVSGGVITEVPRIATAEEWCEFHGVEVKDGVATLFKAVDGEFRSRHGATYVPGTEPQAPDWDGGEEDCGGGLHFCASPDLALEFEPRATRFVACPVRVDEIAVSRSPRFQDKVKAKRVCAPVYEVDEAGTPV